MSIYTNIGLRRVINASGRVTTLGVSTLSDRVAAAAVAGGQSYVIIDELIDRAGQLLAAHTGAEDACVTSCASAAICLAVGGIITQGRRSAVMRLPDASGLANEIVLQKGHAIEFGAPITTMIRVGGGVPVEAGTVNEVVPVDVEEAITERTAALLYVKSHHCVQKGMVGIEAVRDIAHDHDLPLIIDAAAEEDLHRYIELGADLVCYSGAKAFEATTSGFLTGKAQLIDWAKKQYHGVGRAMKVGKEQIMGLLEALDQYDERDHAALANRNHQTVIWLVEQIDAIEGLRAKEIRDEAGREIWRARITVDPVRASGNGMTAIRLNDALRGGDPCVWTRTEFINLGEIDLDPRPLIEGDRELIVARISEIMRA